MEKEWEIENRKDSHSKEDACSVTLTNWRKRTAGIRGRILGIERRIRGRNSEESLDMFSEFKESKEQLQRGEELVESQGWEESRMEIQSIESSFAKIEEKDGNNSEREILGESNAEI